MHDTFLLSNISKSLTELCEKNKIIKLERIIIAVNCNSHVNEENLLEHLKHHNSELIVNTIKIKVNRENIEEQTAIIKSIQGETFGD